MVSTTHTFFMNRKIQSPLYLYSLIPAERELSYNLRMPHLYDPQIERTMRFSNTYFQNCVSERNRLDVSERSCTTISEFKKRLPLRIGPPSKRFIFNIHDLIGIKLLTQLQVEFSGLHEHRFRHNILCSSPFCSCQTGIEDNDHFLLHCPFFSSHRRDLLDMLSSSIDFDIMRIFLRSR